MAKVYLNGSYVDAADAKVPVTDRGLLFGDSVYEVIPAFAGAPFRAAEHLARLQRSLDAILIDNPLSRDQWMEVLLTLSGDYPGQDLGIYLQVTRGAYHKRAHKLPAQAEPTVIAFANPLPPRDPRIALEGISVVTLQDQRWLHCDLKTTNLLPNVLALAEANQAGADDAILLREGQAIEGTASNLFVLLDGLLITPPDSTHLLPGITRDLVLELAQQHGIAHARATIAEPELRHASEIWLTSSTREIAPVVQLDGKPVDDGRPGPAWRQMDGLYQQAKQRLREQADPA